MQHLARLLHRGSRSLECHLTGGVVAHDKVVFGQAHIKYAVLAGAGCRFVHVGGGGGEVLPDQALGIPLVHHGEIVQIGILHEAVFHLAVPYHEAGNDVIACGEILLPVRVHPVDRVIVVFEGSQNLIIVIISDGDIQSLRLQPVLPKRQPLGGFRVGKHPVGLRHDAGICIRVLAELLVLVNHGEIVGHGILVVGQIVDDLIVHGGVDGAAVVVDKAVPQIREIPGCHQQGSLGAGIGDRDTCDVQIHAGPFLKLNVNGVVLHAVHGGKQGGAGSPSTGKGSHPPRSGEARSPWDGN